MKQKITVNSNQIERVYLNGIEEIKSLKYYPKQKDVKLFFGLFNIRGREEFFSTDSIIEYTRKDLDDLDYKIVANVVYVKPSVTIAYVSGYRKSFYFETYKDAKLFYEEIGVCAENLKKTKCGYCLLIAKKINHLET